MAYAQQSLHLKLHHVNLSKFVHEEEIEVMETFDVTLDGPGPFGFRLTGGTDFKMPVRVALVCRCFVTSFKTEPDLVNFPVNFLIYTLQCFQFYATQVFLFVCLFVFHSLLKGY